MAGLGAQDLVGKALTIARLSHLDPENYRPHALHAAERAWPQTNCYVDLWIEVLSALGAPPQACLPFTVTQDFEGDQITFFKIPVEDIEKLYGLLTQELAIFDRIEDHVAVQVERGRLCLVETDSFFLPDTKGVSYRAEHGKTTIGVNKIDIASRRLDYFHNESYFRIEGEDFDGLFRRGDFGALEVPFLPYTEFVKFDGFFRRDDIKSVSLDLFRRHLARRPKANPIAALADALPAQARAIPAKSEGFFHKYAFNTLRQLGANFALLADYLLWLDAAGGDHKGAVADANKIADTAKIVQFQLARAVARQKFDALGPALAPAVEAWDALMARLVSAHGC